MLNPAQANANEYASRMRRCCFDGDFDGFHAHFQQYLARHAKDDPHARLLLQKCADTSNGLFSYRSATADMEENRRQSSLRWEAWMSVMPLDLQLSLLVMEASRRDPSPFPPSRLKWQQWDQVASSPDCEHALAQSPLCGIRPIKATWGRVNTCLASLVHQHACFLVASRAWPDLRAWMHASGMHACDPVSVLQVHHVSRYSHGRTSARAHRPLPFWATGVFASATQAEFWDTMSLFGGPSDPSTAFCSPSFKPSRTSAPHRPGQVPIRFPKSLRQQPPLSWIEPMAQLWPDAIAAIEQTWSQWSAHAMDASAPMPSPASPSPRL